MKTIFITSFHPFISRNLLLNEGFIKSLRDDSDLRVVIFCPDYKQFFFEKYFKKDNVIIEGVRNNMINRQDVLFSYLGRSVIMTKTLSIHRKEIFLKNKKLLAFCGSFFLAWAGRWLPVKQLVRWLDRLTISKNRFTDYFDKYNPDLVFAADLFHVDDVHFLAEAKQRSILTAGMIRSWDNITGKGLFRIKPDKLIVPNEIIKDEATRYEDMNSQDIYVSGLPQMDFYINNMERTERNIFFSKIGLDSKKTTIFVAPHGCRFFDSDGYLLEQLKKLPYQYIVRLPPNDNINLLNFKPTSAFFMEHPGISFKDGVYIDRELSLFDSFTLADELFHSDLIINYGSSIAIEAAFYDKPIINICNDGPKDKPYIKSERRFLNFSHLNKMWQVNFCKIAYSFEELKNYISEYLKNPDIDRENRKKFLYDQTRVLDGKSGTRLADFLVEMLSENN